MKKKLLSIILFSSVVMNAQVTIFEDSFEDYDDFIITNIGNWITLDLDKSDTFRDTMGEVWENEYDPQAFIIFNPSAVGIESASGFTSYDPKTGKKYAGSWAAEMPDQDGTGPNNDWLISPALNLGASANQVRFWVKSVSEVFGAESYEVGVYEGSGTPTASSDFTLISGDKPLIAPFVNWEEKTFNLDDYANKTVRIGIHCVSSNKFFFVVDDFKVVTAEKTAGTQEFFAKNVTAYPNPANDMLNISTKKGVEIKKIELTDLSGRVVKQLPAQTETEVRINLAGLTSGIYFISVETSEGKGTSKFIKS